MVIRASAAFAMMRAAVLLSISASELQQAAHMPGARVLTIVVDADLCCYHPQPTTADWQQHMHLFGWYAWLDHGR